MEQKSNSNIFKINDIENAPTKTTSKDLKMDKIEIEMIKSHNDIILKEDNTSFDGSISASKLNIINSPMNKSSLLNENSEYNSHYFQNIYNSDENNINKCIYENFKDLGFQNKKLNDELSSDNRDHLYFLEKESQNDSLNNERIMSKITDDSKQIQKNCFINKKRGCSSKRRKTKNKKSQRSVRDYLIKSFLSNFVNKYLFNKLNILSKKCSLGKIYKANYKSNIKPNEHKLSPFLEKTVKDIFTFFDNKKEKEYKYQEENFNLAKELYNKVNLSKDEEELKKYLDSTIETQLKLYYESKELQKFKKKNLSMELQLIMI